jgi:hypothetical protein
MSEAKMSYLRGFDANNDYRANGLFPGSSNPGFAVSALFRDRAPQSTLGGEFSLTKCVCGNQLDVGGGSLAGWNLVMYTPQAGATPIIILNYAKSNGTNGQLEMQLFDDVVAQRTLFPQFFFGLTTQVGKGNNDTAIIALNGSVLAIVTGLGGYTPAPSNAPFIVGNGTNTGADPASTIGFAGMSYQDQVCDDPQSIDSYQQVVNIIADQWEAVNADEDIRDADLPIITDVFSVRRGLPDVDDGEEPTWAAEKGGAILTRRGSTSLKVEACKPRYFTGIVEAGSGS